MIILCDFDGTVVPKLPESGSTLYDTGAAHVLKKLVDAGHDIVLWTCRNESPDNPFNYINGKLREISSLQEAINWFEDNGIPLKGVNGFEGEESTGIGTSRKLLADILIDDMAMGTPLKSNLVTYTSYATGEKHIARLSHVDWTKMDHMFKKAGFYDN